MNQPFVRVLGSADWRQTKNNDNSCYTLSDKVLIDVNSALVMNLLNQDIEPTDFETIFFTHMHADHYMGLAPLLHRWRVVRGDLGDLTIVGPKATVREHVELSIEYAFHGKEELLSIIKRYPKIVELDEGDSYDHEDFRVEVMASDHAVPGLCYRFTDKATGRTVGFSGDTRIQPQYAKLFQDVDLLLYECSYGGGPLDESNERSRHSSAREAADVCIQSGAKRLLLTHTYEPKREAALAEGRRRLTIPVDWAMPGKCFEF